MATATLERTPVLPQSADAPALQALAAVLAADATPTTLKGPGKAPVPLPASVRDLLARVVHELVRGNAVTIVPVHAELTTQQAAELLNMSRPHLVKLLEAGAIPFHKTGTHRRVKITDALAYRDRQRTSQRAALDELAREAQELGLYQ